MTPIGKFAKLLLALTVAAALVMGMSGCKKEEPASVAKPAAPGSQVVEIQVTDRGYEPSPVTLKKGEPVTLHVTRTTDRTCATEFVLDEHQINEKLPMGQTVTIRFTPEKDGELVYGCGMDKMISGRFVVQ